jgi:hypothetical protein
MTRQPVEQAPQRRQAQLDGLRREAIADVFDVGRDVDRAYISQRAQPGDRLEAQEVGAAFI